MHLHVGDNARVNVNAATAHGSRADGLGRAGAPPNVDGCHEAWRWDEEDEITA